MAQPIIALVGRPNVGKSTLFNRLTKTRDALVADMPGITRDRQYGKARLGSQEFIVVDTGGLSGDSEGVDPLMAGQVQMALEEAHAIAFIVDGREGLSPADEAIANYIRSYGKPTQVLVNKTEGFNLDLVLADFYNLGLGEPWGISSAHGDYVTDAFEELIATLPPETYEDSTEEFLDENAIRVAIVGRPNVGKSTLVNRILGEERLVAFDMPGTTRDSIFVPFEKDGRLYTFIDTAGIRRKRSIDEKIERFSVIKAMEAMQGAHVVLMVIDGSEGVTEQDLRLLGHAIDSGRGLVLAINKWDGLSQDQRNKVKHEIDLRLGFVDYAKTHLISALHGTGVGNLFATINQVYKAATQKVSTSNLNRVLEQAVLEHQPPLIGKIRMKLRYAHLGGLNPPRIIIHGNRLEKIPQDYTRYLANVFRKAFKWVGTPIFIEYRTTKNPYDKTEGMSPELRQRKRRIESFKKSKEERRRR